MNRLATILVVADPGMQHTPALRLGAELARLAGARLQVCLFDHDPLVERTADLVHPDVMRLARAQFEQRRSRWLDGAADAIAARGQGVECEMVWAPQLHEALVGRCLEIAPDLVIKDAAAPSLPPAVDRKLLRYCPAPLLLLRADTTGLPRRIVAAVDTAPLTDAVTSLNAAIARAAQGLAFCAGADVHLAHCFPFARPGTTPNPNLRRLQDVVRDDDERAFAHLGDQHCVALERRHFVDGRPEEQLPDLVAQLGADLLVLGANYRSGVERFTLGDTAERLLAAPPCNLLLVKSPGFLDELAAHLDFATLRRHYGRSASLGTSAAERVRTRA